jgi:hypothetical protein
MQGGIFFASLYRIAPRVGNALVFVKPETVIRWHRAGFRSFWRWKSRCRGGRPKVPLEIRQLIRAMSLANPPWGAPRIHGELLKLGIDVGQTLGRQVHGKAQETPLSRLQDVIEAIFDPIFEVRTAFVFGVVDRLKEFSVAPGATDAFRGAASGGLDQARISDARYEVDMAWIFLNPNGRIGPLMSPVGPTPAILPAWVELGLWVEGGDSN